MKYFREEDIAQLISEKGLIDEIERFYINNPEVVVPDRIHIEDRKNTILIMPAIDTDYYAIKLVGVSPNNKKMDKPSIHGTVILHDRNTLEPLAFFDGKAVTAIRTGAIGGLSIKYLSKESASSIGIVGTGVQGWNHLAAALAVRDIKKVFLYNRSFDQLQLFRQQVLNKYPNLEVISTSVEQLIKGSDIIITTTTSATPVLPELDILDWEGKHIVAVGSFKPTMQELPNSLLQHATPMFVDTLTALTESGDMIKASELQGSRGVFYTLEDVVKGSHEISSSFTLFKSVGMSLFDLITAKYIYEKDTLTR